MIADTVCIIDGRGLVLKVWGMTEAQARKLRRDPVIVAFSVGDDEQVGDHGASHRVGQEKHPRGLWWGCTVCGVAGAARLTTTPCAGQRVVSPSEAAP